FHHQSLGPSGESGSAAARLITSRRRSPSDSTGFTITDSSAPKDSKNHTEFFLPHPRCASSRSPTRTDPDARGSSSASARASAPSRISRFSSAISLLRRWAFASATMCGARGAVAASITVSLGRGGTAGVGLRLFLGYVDQYPRAVVDGEPLDADSEAQRREGR